MENENAIEVRNMSKSFKIEKDGAKTIKELFVRHKHEKAQYHQVLKNINLDIKKGETVALIGVNGSGKSTLLKLMTKIIYPTEGTVKTYGKLTSLLELGAGFHPDFTGRENIYFNAAIFGLNKREIEARMDDIIAFSELGDAIDEPIRTYSSGMYMRLAFSIAINVDAEILLVDEILAVGDQHFQDKCFDKLRELRDSDKTIVIVTHSLDVVKDLCSRAIWIYKGEFRLDGDPVYVIDEYLKQVAEDHRIEKRKQLEEGTAVAKGIVFLDHPKDFTHIQKDNPYINYCGWKLCDDETATFHIYVGKTEITDINYSPRYDVMETYQEQYGGLVDEKTIGFNISLNMNEYEKEFDANGSVKIRAVIMNQKGESITEKSVVVTLDGE